MQSDIYDLVYVLMGGAFLFSNLMQMQSSSESARLRKAYGSGIAAMEAKGIDTDELPIMLDDIAFAYLVQAKETPVKSAIALGLESVEI